MKKSSFLSRKNLYRTFIIIDGTPLKYMPKNIKMKDRNQFSLCKIINRDNNFITSIIYYS